MGLWCGQTVRKATVFFGVGPALGPVEASEPAAHCKDRGARGLIHMRQKPNLTGRQRVLIWHRDRVDTRVRVSHCASAMRRSRGWSQIQAGVRDASSSERAGARVAGNAGSRLVLQKLSAGTTSRRSVTIARTTAPKNPDAWSPMPPAARYVKVLVCCDCLATNLAKSARTTPHCGALDAEYASAASRSTTTTKKNAGSIPSSREWRKFFSCGVVVVVGRKSSKPKTNDFCPNFNVGRTSRRSEPFERT